MPKTNVIFYKEDDGTVPTLEWLDSLQPKALDKCTVRIERLAQMVMTSAVRKQIFCATGFTNLGLGCST
jgi:hypothetical protein